MEREIYMGLWSHLTEFSTQMLYQYVWPLSAKLPKG